MRSRGNNLIYQMSRAVLAPFEAYQKARVTFVQTIAELAQRPQNIEALQSAGTYRHYGLFESDPLLTCSIANFYYLRCHGVASPTSTGQRSKHSVVSRSRAWPSS